MTLSTDANALADGVPIHPGEAPRYLGRTRTSWELLNRNRDLIPIGHGGGMRYEMPHTLLLNRGKGWGVWNVDGVEYPDLHHVSFGSFPLSTSHTEDDIDSLLGGIERALHNLGYVS